jgi:hypothetical protein
MQALSKATFHVDRFCQSHTFEALWRKNMFRIDLIDGQKDSMLMSLPLEIRLMIWKYVLSPPYNNSANILSVLATCRLVHGEAVVHALKSITFFVGRGRTPCFRDLYVADLGDKETAIQDTGWHADQADDCGVHKE